MTKQIVVIPFEQNPGIASTPLVRVNAATRQQLKQKFNLEGVQVFEDSEFLGVIQDQEDNEKVYGGAFGHPVFMPLVFERTSYDFVDADGTVQFLETPELFIPLLIIECDRAKNAEMTPMEGFNGTVKEIAGQGDYRITMRGILIGDDDKYPQDQVGFLNEIENALTVVSIANDFFAMLGVTDVLIKRIKYLPPEENSQAFEIEAYSDNPVMLRLDDEVIIN